MDFSHLDEQGQAKMVDISSKDISRRSAKAKGLIFLHKTTIEKIKNNLIKKGDVLAVARIAAISGGKKTSELIPLCHNILISKIDISFNILDEKIEIIAEAVCQARTGIEMEALCAVSIAALNIYDMCKAVDKNMIISDIKLVQKSKEKIQIIK